MSLEQLLRAGDTTRVELDLRPKPRLEGRVQLEGRPVSGARVVLQPADRMRATVSSLPGASVLYREIPLVDSPAAHQETWTDPSGRFSLGDWGGAGGDRYLSVTSPDGSRVVTRRIEPSDGAVLIELPPRFPE